MSKKQREKVEDEVRFHRAQLVRPGTGGGGGGQSMNSSGMVTPPTPSSSAASSPNGMTMSSLQGATTLHGQMQLTNVNSATATLLQATNHNGQTTNGLIGTNGGQTQQQQQQQQLNQLQQQQQQQQQHGQHGHGPTSNYATSQTSSSETSPDSSVLEQQPVQQPSSSSQHVPYSSLSNGYVQIHFLLLLSTSNLTSYHPHISTQIGV